MRSDLSVGNTSLVLRPVTLELSEELSRGDKRCAVTLGASPVVLGRNRESQARAREARLLLSNSSLARADPSSSWWTQTLRCPASTSASPRGPTERARRWPCTRRSASCQVAFAQSFSLVQRPRCWWATRCSSVTQAQRLVDVCHGSQGLRTSFNWKRCLLQRRSPCTPLSLHSSSGCRSLWHHRKMVCC